jgi:hypothetical protein
MTYEEIEQRAFKHHRPSARSFGRQVYDIQQARIAELEKTPRLSNLIKLEYAESEILDLQKRIVELDIGLALLANGDTPWISTDSVGKQGWELMAKYARQLLKGSE